MQTKQKLNKLIWFTTNLRIQDNKSLSEALKPDGDLKAVYCLDPAWFKSGSLGFPKMNRFRAQFLLESLDNLSIQLNQLGIPFEILFDTPAKALPRFLIKNEIDRVYMQKDWTSEELETLFDVKSASPDYIEWNRYYDQFLIAPHDLPFPLEMLPEQFTPFRKKIEKQLFIRPETNSNQQESSFQDLETKIPTLSTLGFSDDTQDARTAFPFKGGEKSAMERMHAYFWKSDAIQSYKDTRNGLIGADYSSKLSSWLALGCISSRTIYHELKRYEEDRTKNQSTYWLYFELLWRDYFKYVSLKYGNAIFYPRGIRDKSISWKKDKEVFRKWAEGKTQNDFVNANMLELKHTGWMSNRGRQNVASYLTKTLGVDWRWGAAYFESMLIDYDVHSNYGNWMYVAGVGNDPRDRIFNVEKQAAHYDPNEEFQELWLSKVPTA